MNKFLEELIELEPAIIAVEPGFHLRSNVVDVVEKHLPGEHEQKDHGRREKTAITTSAVLTSDISDGDIDEWLKAMDDPALKSEAQYKDFLVSFFENIDEADLHPVGLRDDLGKMQVMLAGSFVKGALIELATKTPSPIRGRCYYIDDIAVAPWNHPKMPGRIKGWGTRMFVSACRHALKRGAQGIVLSSLNDESDKFYEALGMSRVPGEQSSRMFYMTAEDAKGLVDDYKKRRKEGHRAGGQVDLGTAPKKEEPPPAAPKEGR